MTTGPRRTFTILDAMILTAATAAGLALMKAIGREFLPPRSSGVLWSLGVLIEGIYLSWYFLLAWAPALMVLRGIPPRPRFRKLIREPGTVACIAVLAAIGIQATSFLFLSATIGTDAAANRGFIVRPMFMVDRYGTQVVFSAVGAWSTLILIAGWRPARDWIDRLGRVVGFAWISGYAAIQVALIVVALS